MGIGTDPNDGAAFFIHTHEEGNLCGGLIRGNGLDQIIGCFVLGVPAKEDVAAKMIGADILHGIFPRTANKEQLSHLFLQSHFLQKGFNGVRLDHFNRRDILFFLHNGRGRCGNFGGLDLLFSAAAQEKGR